MTDDRSTAIRRAAQPSVCPDCGRTYYSAGAHMEECRGRSFTCAVCDHPYTSRYHRDTCMAGVSSEECMCPPGPCLPDCVEVVG